MAVTLTHAHSQTHRFCYHVMRHWQNETTCSSQQNCSYCLLATLQLDQSSEISYSGEFADQFHSLTSSCGSTTGFEPTILVLTTTPDTSSTASTTATSASSSCASTYTIQPGDTCNGICKANNVPTDALLAANRLKAYCRDFTAPGTKLYMPQQCDIYTVKRNNTCRSIATGRPTYITITQLQAWTPKCPMYQHRPAGGYADLRQV